MSQSSLIETKNKDENAQREKDRERDREMKRDKKWVREKERNMKILKWFKGAHHSRTKSGK